MIPGEQEHRRSQAEVQRRLEGLVALAGDAQAGRILARGRGVDALLDGPDLRGNGLARGEREPALLGDPCT